MAQVEPPPEMPASDTTPVGISAAPFPTSSLLIGLKSSRRVFKYLDPSLLPRWEIYMELQAPEFVLLLLWLL